MSIVMEVQLIAQVGPVLIDRHDTAAIVVPNKLRGHVAQRAPRRTNPPVRP